MVNVLKCRGDRGEDLKHGGRAREAAPCRMERRAHSHAVSAAVTADGAADWAAEQTAAANAAARTRPRGCRGAASKRRSRARCKERRREAHRFITGAAIGAATGAAAAGHSSRHAHLAGGDLVSHGAGGDLAHHHIGGAAEVPGAAQVTAAIAADDSEISAQVDRETVSCDSVFSGSTGAVSTGVQTYSVQQWFVWFWWLWAWCTVCCVYGNTAVDFVLGAVCCYSFYRLLGCDVWGPTVVQRALLVAPLRGVWGDKTPSTSGKAPRRMSKKRRMIAAWAKVVDLMVERGAAGECPRQLLLAERQCEQLGLQLHEAQVQAKQAAKQAKEQLEFEKRAHRRSVSAAKAAAEGKIRRLEKNHHSDMQTLQRQLDLLLGDLQIKDQKHAEVREEERERAQDAEEAAEDAEMQRLQHEAEVQALQEVLGEVGCVNDQLFLLCSRYIGQEICSECDRAGQVLTGEQVQQMVQALIDRGCKRVQEQQDYQLRVQESQRQLEGRVQAARAQHLRVIQ